MVELWKKADRTVVQALTGIPDGQTITKVHWMVKNALDDADADALLTKTVTTVLGASGQVTDTGADGTGSASIRIADDDLDDLLLGKTYRIGIKVICSSGDAYACDGYDSFLKILGSGVDATS
jgi:hypothetical protein